MKDTKSNTSKPSYRYAVISIAIVLYFLGIYMMLYLQSSQIDQMIKEQVSIVVELKKGANAENQAILKETILQHSGIIANSIKYHDQSSANDIMGYSDMIDFESGESPYRDMLTFRMKAAYYTDENLQEIDKSIMNVSSVHDVFFESESDVGVHDFVQRLSLLFLLLSVIFIGLALIIIHNTLSLSLYADRWEIKTMELVGARKSFIRKPYVAHGRIIGQKAFGVAAIALILSIGILYRYVDLIGTVFYWPYLLLTLVLLFVLSTLITMISTFTVVNKFLDQNLSELHG